MKKQFVTLMAILGLSASLAGCGKATDKVVPETTVETEVQENEVQENEVSEMPAEDLSTEETPAAAEELTTEEAETPVTKELTETKEDTSKPENQKETTTAETKPSTSTSTGNTSSSKPSTNTSSGSTSSSKPSTNTSNSTTSTSKPSTNTSSTPNSNSSSSGNTTTPEAKPEATPEVKPEAAPEVKPEATPEAASLSAEEIFSNITSGMEFPMQMSVDATLLSDLYGIDTSLLESFCVKMPMMSAHISEIGVFKVKDASNVSSIVAGINQRAGNVGQCLYPSLLETFESRVITTKGNYILFAMDENASKIEASFNSLVK